MNCVCFFFFSSSFFFFFTYLDVSRHSHALLPLYEAVLENKTKENLFVKEGRKAAMRLPCL